MLFHAFRVVYTVKEFDSHAKHGQSLKKKIGRITEYFCAKNLTSGFVQVSESFFRSLFLMTVELLIWAFLSEECVRARIDRSENKSAPINTLQSAGWQHGTRSGRMSLKKCFWL